MTNRYVQNGETFVECSCTHMTSFAVLMDASDKEVCNLKFHNFSKFSDKYLNQSKRSLYPALLISDKMLILNEPSH